MIKKSHNNKTFGEISGRYWSRVKKNAKRINMEISVSIEEAWDIFLKQEGKCAYSGLKITHEKYSKIMNKRSFYNLGTASLDRKNSDLGYTKNNIQWVHKDVNFMKMDFKECYFLKLCKLIAKQTKRESLKCL
jgi:hypothetical protein